MKYFSTFSGIGGFELGIGDKADCIGYSEIDKYASQIYQSHFPTHRNYGDITIIDADALPDFDLFVGGFPCQAFSVAGKRRGFDDTRGTLFFDIARILRTKRPRLLLLENVKGLLSHDDGRTFKTIVAALDELGYDCQWQVLNAKDFGVPQNRERIFIVGHLRGTPRPEVFPFGESGTVYIREDGSQQERGPEFRPTTNTLTSNYWKGVGGNRPFIVEPPHKHGEIRVYQEMIPTMQARWVTGGNNVPYVNAIRKLTPLECERLMGFPDGWTAIVSDTQRYKCLGNGVVTNVVQAIMERII